ncbi:MAG: AEC family transporter [Oscillospiraceae bacterium]|nr:AEC family transporter [Oscillospiraceae bacterium]
MENFMLSANAVLPMFLLLAAGFLSQKAGVLTREDVPRFNKVAFRIFLPCLLFYNIYCSDLSAAVKPGLIVYAVCGVLLVFTAAYVAVKHLVPREDWKGVIAQGIFRSNFVIMGIPIALALVGADQLGAVTVLIAVVVPLFNFLSVYVLERFRGGTVNVRKVLLEVAKNPLIVSSLLGILCQLLGLRLPGLLEQTVSSLSVIASPLQLFLLGAFFRFDGLGRYVRPLAAVTAVKLFVTPAVLLGTAAMLGIRGGDFVGLIGIFASPTAVNSFTMVQQMDCGDAELAGDIVVTTSAVSILSFFLWILVFKTLGVF